MQIENKEIERELDYSENQIKQFLKNINGNTVCLAQAFLYLRNVVIAQQIQIQEFEKWIDEIRKIKNAQN